MSKKTTPRAAALPAGDPHWETLMGRGPKRIVHAEIWSDPDAETWLTGIDYYAHPRQCRL